MRGVIIAAFVTVALLAVVGISLMFLSSSESDDELGSGTYRTVEEAEKAVGFVIPHARDTGAFRLKEVSVSGGTRTPGNVDVTKLDLGKVPDGFTPVLASTRTEWGISLLYEAETEQRHIVVSFTPRTELPTSSGTGKEPQAHGRPVHVDYLPPGSTFIRRASVSWVDTYGFIAWATLDSPASRYPGVKLDEFLDLVRSVR